MSMQQLYFDIEDDITSIIAKIDAASDDTVALIPPKRSSVLQSAVNLKLIKKAAKEAGKKIAIITKDPSILNLAANVGMLVAPNLQATPEVPVITSAKADIPSDTITEESKTVIPEPAEAEAALEAMPASHKIKPKAANKNGNIPDFNRFKKRMMLAALALLLLGVGVMGAKYLLPEAVVSIDARTDKLKSNFTFKASTTATSPDFEAATLPAEAKEVEKTLTATFKATGKKEVGDKATGEVSVSNCRSNESITITKGTKFTAESGHVFLATETVNVPGGQGNFIVGCTQPGAAPVKVAARLPGEEYNIGPSSYSVEGYNSEDGVTAQGGNMSGGSSRTITVISQEDVAQARQKLLEDERPKTRQELADGFADSKYVIEASFREKVAETTVEPKVGAETEQGRIVIRVAYALFAVTRADLNELLTAKQEEQASQEKQGLSVLDNGLESAQINAEDPKGASTPAFKIEAQAILGPDINLENLAKDIAGRGYSETIQHVKSLPNINHVEVKLAPFWVSKLPKDPAKIEIRINLPGDEPSDG